MESYSIYLGRKNQCCGNGYITKCNLQIQCDPYQITNGFLTELEQKNFTTHMEIQKTPNSQISRERRMELEESTTLTSDYTTKL